MTVTERERYVRWWIEESGLTLAQLREVAGAVWTDGEKESREGDDPLSGPEDAAPR
jgi:hypothetical protein